MCWASPSIWACSVVRSRIVRENAPTGVSWKELILLKVFASLILSGGKKLVGAVPIDLSALSKLICAVRKGVREYFFVLGRD